MTTSNLNQPDYGNWVGLKFVYGPGILAILFLALSFLFAPLIALAILFAAVAVYFAYARYLFSPGGGNVQARVQISCPSCVSC